MLARVSLSNDHIQLEAVLSYSVNSFTTDDPQRTLELDLLFKPVIASTSLSARHGLVLEPRRLTLDHCTHIHERGFLSFRYFLFS
jgi:hypothetical protein